jgi:hypothetical protein
MADAQPESRDERGKIITFGIVVIVILIIGYTLYTGGATSVVGLVKKVFQYVLIVAILGAVIWVVFRLLQKRKIDLVAKGIDDIIQAGILSKSPMVKDLYFTGDKEHSEFRVGQIVGYCQLQSYKDLNKISGLTEGQLKAMKAKGIEPSQYIINESAFIFKKMSFPFSLFEKPKVLRCLETEHSQLIGDVKVFAVSMIKKYGYYWPNTAHLDIARIDISIIREAWRGYIDEFLRDSVELSRSLLGMNPDLQTELQKRKLLKIPSPMGEQESKQ